MAKKTNKPNEQEQVQEQNVHPLDIMNGVKKKTGEVVRERHPIDDEQQEPTTWEKEMQDFNPMKKDEVNLVDDSNLVR